MSFYRKREDRRVEAKIAQLREKVERNEAFNKIPKYYINLDRSIDRREALEKEIALYEVENIHRFKAIDGRDIKDIHQGEIEGVHYVNDYSNCTKYQLAVTLSHLECIHRAGEKGIFPFIILEDDVRFTLMPHWKKNIDEIISELPEDCDILNLVSIGSENTNKEFLQGNMSCALASLITKKGYINLINLFFDNTICSLKKNLKLDNINIDSSIRMELKTYHYNPVLFLLDGISQKNSTKGTEYNLYSFNKYFLRSY